MISSVYTAACSGESNGSRARPHQRRGRRPDHRGRADRHRGRLLKELGYSDVLLVEATDDAGGLASSFVDDRGFTWDVGGHVLFSRDDCFDDAMREALGEAGWLQHERESWVWIASRFVPYPLQSNLRHLPADLMGKAVRGLAARPTRAPSPTLDAVLLDVPETTFRFPDTANAMWGKTRR